MNGIIYAEEDVKILRKFGTLLNHLKSDKAMASLWNGMTTSAKISDNAKETIQECVPEYISFITVEANDRLSEGATQDNHGGRCALGYEQTRIR